MNKNKNIKDASFKAEVTRKEAIQKVGKYAAFTATAMFTILSPKESQAASPSSPAAPGAWPTPPSPGN